MFARPEEAVELMCSGIQRSGASLGKEADRETSLCNWKSMSWTFLLPSFGRQGTAMGASEHVLLEADGLHKKNRTARVDGSHLEQWRG